MDNESRNIELNTCYGCMKKLPEGVRICPSCGYDNSRRQNPENTLPEGTVLNGKYLIGKVLGNGGFGITYLGYELNLEIPVAIKEYFPMGFCTRLSQSYNVMTAMSAENSPAFSKGCDAFLDEARTLARFNSPHIVHVREFFKEHGTAYIVMDYVNGKTLQAEIKACGGRLETDRVLTLMKPLISQLDRLHGQSIIHRDIKPANLMLVYDENGEHLVLLDFGAARNCVSNETKTLTGMVSAGYSPLEQYSHRSRQGPYTDVYALCATIYRSITGAAPPDATERSADELPIPPFSAYGLHEPQVERALLHGLALKREDRTQSMKQLSEELYQEQKPEPDPRKEREQDFFRACELQRTAVTEEDYRKAIHEFEKLSSVFPEATDHIRECEASVTGLKKEPVSDSENGKTKEEKLTQNDQPEKPAVKPSKARKITAVLAAVILMIAGAYFGFLRDRIGENEKPDTLKPTPMSESSPDASMTSSPKSTTGAYSVGDIVTFGQYEQDNNLSNGKEEIEWIVLDVQGNKALLISKYGLEARAYHSELEDTTWEKCTLRNWLNSTFLESAFSADEQKAIMMTEVDNSKKQGNSEWNTDGGNDTKDQIFLLSFKEANDYFKNNGARECKATKYVIGQGAFVIDEELLQKYSFYSKDDLGKCWWWLRSPSEYQNYAALVIRGGYLDGSGSVSNGRYVVRPAFWINLKSMSPDVVSSSSTSKESAMPVKTSGSSVDVSAGNTEETKIPSSQVSTTGAYSVGDIVTFGQYEQDNNLSNGKEEIEWIVLDVQGNRSLLISRYGLEARAYHSELEDTTWEKCTLRNWLNSTFLESAFSADEQKAIMMTEVDNSKKQGNSEWNTDGGNDTKDKIFLLSFKEANDYFINNDARECKATKYAIGQGAFVIDEELLQIYSTYSKDDLGKCWWWLRSPGELQTSAAFVYSDGFLDNSNLVDYFDIVVRPAFWINLESDIF
ncbi:MAG: serine/threonine protein kinase [Oscillospiraceae bacterium]|nr:serine/threonine protein kinase [Oscillospiraceae bacterium]